MILADIIEVLAGPDRIIIQDADEKMLYCGYVGLYASNKPQEPWNNMRVLKVGMYVETRHRDWKDRFLSSPLEPLTVADYSYSDLEQRIYYRVTVGTDEQFEAAEHLQDSTELR